MRARRVDSTHREIVRTLRSVGASVFAVSPTGSADAGAPDLVVGFRRVTYLLEVKTPGQKPRQNQVTWHEGWRGAPVVVVWTPGDALRAIGLEGGD